MTLTRSGSEIAAYFALASEAGVPTELDGSTLRPRYNLAPSHDLLTIELDAHGERAFHWRHWGLVPGWAKDPSMGGKLFNARSETVATKPSFRSAFRRSRCLVVADGFYEWTPRSRGHQPHHFRPRAGPLLAFAGLAERWQGAGGVVVDSCTVLTTEANADVATVHPRMPVILAPTDFDRWLLPTAEPDGLKSLLGPAPQGTLERRAVRRIVNDPRQDDPRCLEPEPLPVQSSLFELQG